MLWVSILLGGQSWEHGLSAPNMTLAVLTTGRVTSREPARHTTGRARITATPTKGTVWLRGLLTTIVSGQQQPLNATALTRDVYITSVYIYLEVRLMGMLRSYHHESTRSHQNSEVKRGWARLVLG